MAKNSYLTQYVHGCRRFRKFGDYWLSQFKVHPSKEKMDVACEHYAKRYPDAIVKVFKVRCHGRSWVYGIYWIHPEQMKQQDKERKDAESQATCQYCEIRDFENCMFNRQPFQSHWLSGCVESEMGNCYMCDKPAVFIAHDLPTGEKQFCSELHYCQYAGAPYHGEGYYGFTDPAKVKEPARLARARKRLKYAESFSAEKVKKEILEDDDSGLVMKFIYKDREGKLEWTDNGNSDEKGGVLSFGDNPFKPYDIKIGRRMSRLPHSQKIEDIKSKLEAKEIFKIMMDKPCQSCGDAIHKKGIGSCGWCEDDYGMRMKFDPYKDIKDNKWWDRQSDSRKDFYLWAELTNKNPYCRDCLYYYKGHGGNYPNKFDRESANYSLGNAVCEKHWDEIVAEGGLSKDTKRHSLYEIENVSPRERMMKQRFGFGSETFEAPRNCALCGVSGHNRRTCPTKGINPFSNGDTIICKKDSGGRHKVFIVDDLAKYTESPNGEIILEHPNGLKSGFDDIDDVKYFFEVYDPTDEKYELGFYPMLMNGRIKEYKKRFGSIQPSKQHYIPKYKVGDKVKILNMDDGHGFKVGEIVIITGLVSEIIINVVNVDGKERVVSLENAELVKDKYIPKYKVGDILMLGGGEETIEIVRVDEETGSYYRLHRGDQGTVKMDIKRIDDSPDFELYVPPTTNPRIARLKKRFGLGAENEYVKTGVASLVVVSLLGFALFKRN